MLWLLLKLLEFRGLNGIVKILTFYFFMDKFYDLIEKIQKESMNGLIEILKKISLTFNYFAVDASGKPQLETAKKLDEKVYTAYLMNACFTGLSLCITPIIKDIFSWAFGNGDYNHTVPYKAWYFYDTNTHPWYEITYLSD
jgi:hypothetical protein